MKCVEVRSHRGGREEAKDRGLDGFVEAIFDAPRVKIAAGATDVIRDHIRKQLTSAGWSGEATIRAGFNLTVFSLFKDIAFQLQTGNISRVPYDLIKLQSLYMDQRIGLGVLALPTKAAAKIIASNVASFERVQNEMKLFERVISVPILLVGFE